DLVGLKRDGPVRHLQRRFHGRLPVQAFCQSSALSTAAATPTVCPTHRKLLPSGEKRGICEVGGAPGANAIGRECPPAPIKPVPPPLFRPNGIRSRCSSITVVVEAQSRLLIVCVPLRSDSGICGPSGRNKGGGIRRRPRPGDIRPEGLQVAPTPAAHSQTNDRATPSPRPPGVH